MISILLPVLRRPYNAEKVVSSILRSTSEEFEIILLCTIGDRREINACLATEAHEVRICEWVAGPGDYARKINHGFSTTVGEFVFNGADDLEFRPGWDSEALQVAEDTGAGVVATNDLSNPEVKRGKYGTHCLIRRSYVMEKGGSLDGPGFVMHEGYDHNYVDHELCVLARQRGLYAFAPHSHVVHLHPHWGSAPMDETYRKGLKHFRQDRVLYYQRMRDTIKVPRQFRGKA